MDTLKIARTRKNLKQSQVAEILDITVTTISLIESGHVTPQQRTRKKLEMLLGKIDWNATLYDGIRINSNGKQSLINKD